MRSDYSAPDIDTESALRQAAATEESFTQFQSIRAVGGSASGAFSYGAHTSRPLSAADGDQYFETDRGWLYYFAGAAWQLLAGLNMGTDAVRAAITVTANDNGAAFFTTDTGKLWHVEGGVWVDKFVTLDLTTSLKVGGTKVIGTQGAAVADAAGGATVDAEARTAINDLLARLRVHGLIA